MNSKENLTWIPITNPFDQALHEALQQQHHAAQFIALAGRHLIPRLPDDSNTSMKYIPEREMLVGNRLPGGIRIALHLPGLVLQLLDDHFDVKKKLPLEGKSKSRVFEEVKQMLGDSGLDVSSLKNELHYEIPSHPLEDGSPFTVQDAGSFSENSLYRQNAEIILNDIVAAHDHTPPVRVWPHHFDTGMLIPLAFNEENKVSKSIGLGWAIPDSMVKEPYYYLNIWSEKPVNGFNNLSSLPAGEWMNPDWNGAVLKHSELLDRTGPEQQYELVQLFFNSGIDILMEKFSSGERK